MVWLLWIVKHFFKFTSDRLWLEKIFVCLPYLANNQPIISSRNIWNSYTILIYSISFEMNILISESRKVPLKKLGFTCMGWRISNYDWLITVIFLKQLCKDFMPLCHLWHGNRIVLRSNLKEYIFFHGDFCFGNTWKAWIR